MNDLQLASPTSVAILAPSHPAMLLEQVRAAWGDDAKVLHATSAARFTQLLFDVAFVVGDPQGVGAIADSGNVKVVIYLAATGDRLEANDAIRRGADDWFDVQQVTSGDLQQQVGRLLYQRREQNVATQAIQKLSRSHADANQMMRALAHDLTANFMLLEHSLAQLKEQAPIEEVEAEAAQIAACLDQSKRLVGDLGTLADTGDVGMEPQTIDVEEIARDVVRQQHQLLQENEIEIKIDSGLPTVWCHPTRLSQILTNLVRNAALHGCQEKHGMIRISPVHNDRRRHRAVFAVRDNGPGIPLESQDVVFRPGIRLDDANQCGTGLGLSIVQRIAQRSGGGVWVDRDYDAGAGLLVSLPTAPQAVGVVEG